MLPFVDAVHGMVRSALIASASSDDATGHGTSQRAKAKEKARRTGGDVLGCLRPLLERVKDDALLLRTPLGMARSFLRHALNDGTAHAFPNEQIDPRSHQSTVNKLFS